MKVLRSKCRTRVIFAKSELEIITRKLSDVSAVQLVNGEIQFLDNGNGVIASANWEAVDVPETFTALEKVMHLNEWLSCDTDCGIDCKDYYYNSYNSPAGFDIELDEGSYADFYEFPLKYTFDDDLSCKSLWEVHLGLTFKGSFDANVIGKVVAFVDEVEVFGATAYFTFSEDNTSHNPTLHFMLEGDYSGKKLTFGLSHEATASQGGSGVTIEVEDVHSTLIVRKVS